MRSGMHLTTRCRAGRTQTTDKLGSIEVAIGYDSRNRAWGIIVPATPKTYVVRAQHQAARSLAKQEPWDPPGLVRMSSFEAKITNPIDINTIPGGHFRLMPGQYRVTPDRQGGAELIRIDAKQPTSPIRVTPVQWGILEAARFIERP
jgi:hypothetical protein